MSLIVLRQVLEADKQVDFLERIHKMPQTEVLLWPNLVHQVAIRNANYTTEVQTALDEECIPKMPMSLLMHLATMLPLLIVLVDPQ